MTKPNDFAFPFESPDEIFGGLTKREYFAAHAPQMPEWFKELGIVKAGEYHEACWPWYWADRVLSAGKRMGAGE